MNKENMDIVEDAISSFINRKFTDVPPTENEFENSANIIRQANGIIAPITDEEFAYIKKRLREYVVVTLDTGISLQDPDNGHKSWLPARKAEIDFFYWDRYKKYLENAKHWNSRVTSKLGQVSDEILDMCGDPQESSFHIRGLVLGDVQSGKTANYTALANKAADVGYELIIVLAGIPEALRQQTQTRLDKEFCGRQSNLYLDPKSSIKATPVGVGKYGIKKKIASFTSEANDFDVKVLKSNGLGLDNVNCPILLVVKKNKTILNNLIKWLKGNNALNANGRIQKSLFLIDDEADNASVNTKNPDADPAAINQCITTLYGLFEKRTYLAVTATPFANIFIDPNRPEDLFPSDFIYTLDTPSDYIGAERIFSDDADHNGMIENINVDGLIRYIPEKHKKDLVVDGLPLDLYEACNYFLLANAIRDLRGDLIEHRSMMIHISRFVNVQKQIKEIVFAWLDQVKSDVRNYAQLPISKSMEIKSIKDLYDVWVKFSLENRAECDWETILKNYLYKAIAPIDVRFVNSSNGSVGLDYDRHTDDGLRVIAVGGNTLSRGLTLEGLMTTYFYRNTNMYDTLMQMGRWFGYRPNYDDLVKIWMSQDAEDWYAQIYEATQDLKTQISRMKVARLSPAKFGLKVRQDPGSLIVTAKNKMRTAKTIKCPITVSGHLLETPRLYASNKILKQNEVVIERFIEALGINGEKVPMSDERTKGNYLWQGVSSDSVSSLLENFVTHPWHMSYNGKGLAEYVGKHNWNNGWDVAIVNHGEGGAFDRKLKCGDEYISIDETEERNVTKSGDNMLCISGSKLKIGSGGSSRIGLTENQIKIIKEDYYQNYTGKRKKPTLPDSAYLVQGRNPILLIHVVKAKYDPSIKDSYPEFLYGIGVGFPQDNNDESAIYQVNLIELANWLDPDTEEDE